MRLSSTIGAASTLVARPLGGTARSASVATMPCGATARRSVAPRSAAPARVVASEPAAFPGGAAMRISPSAPSPRVTSAPCRGPAALRTSTRTSVPMWTATRGALAASPCLNALRGGGSPGSKGRGAGRGGPRRRPPSPHRRKRRRSRLRPSRRGSRCSAGAASRRGRQRRRPRGLRGTSLWRGRGRFDVGV
ncbi:hypothetical protein M885DRAFT_534824 [Pelagophyceae sp. CCMP2097]|nr:hypothetical protein M885DRAFT_534824 [Pelagophyceae sp. CCMP2097]